MPKYSERKIVIEPVSEKQRRDALLLFDDLLSCKTCEKDWQAFFDKNPFVLTESLSLKLNGLYRQVPLISGIPDYVFYRNTGNRITGDFGVIELKRPDQSILGVYSPKIITPSRDLRIAQQEITQHLEAIQRGEFLNTDDFFLAGNRHYAFIIIGVTSEITRKCHEEIIIRQFRKLLPSGFQLYTYDEVFELFSSEVPPTIQVLFASPVSDFILKVRREFKITWERGLALRPSAQFVQIANQFSSDIKVRKGRQTVNGKSIMGLLTLAIVYGSHIFITIQGRDAQVAMDALAKLFENEFYMKQRYSYQRYHKKKSDEDAKNLRN